MKCISRLLLVIIVLSMTGITSLAAPQAGDFTKQGLVNETVTFAQSDFSNHYTEGAEQSPAIAKIVLGSTIPSDMTGTLKYEQTSVTAGQEIAFDQIDKLYFEPKTDFAGETNFDYKIVNTNGEESNFANVSIVITTLTTAEPQMPITALDGNLTVRKNMAANGEMLAEGVSGREVVYEVVYAPAKGAVTDINNLNGAFTYTPHFNETGADSFTFIVKSGDVVSNEATMNIDIKESISETGFLYQDMLGHWAEYSAIKLADRGNIVGEKINNKFYFDPGVRMTRGDFILFLNSALNLDESQIYDTSNPFADGNIPSWYYAEAKAMYDRGIVNGILDDGQIFLRPGQLLTRIEAMGMIHNAINPSAMSEVDLTYADKDSIPEWAVQIVKNMGGYGLLKGYDDNTVRPFETITRAQAVEMVWQMKKYLEANPGEGVDQTVSADTAKILRVSNMYLMGIPYEGMEPAKLIDALPVTSREAGIE